MTLALIDTHADTHLETLDVLDSRVVEACNLVKPWQGKYFSHWRPLVNGSVKNEGQEDNSFLWQLGMVVKPSWELPDLLVQLLFHSLPVLPVVKRALLDHHVVDDTSIRPDVAGKRIEWWSKDSFRSIECGHETWRTLGLDFIGLFLRWISNLCKAVWNFELHSSLSRIQKNSLGSQSSVCYSKKMKVRQSNGEFSRPSFSQRLRDNSWFRDSLLKRAVRSHLTEQVHLLSLDWSKDTNQSSNVWVVQLDKDWEVSS